MKSRNLFLQLFLWLFNWHRRNWNWHSSLSSLFRHSKTLDKREKNNFLKKFSWIIKQAIIDEWAEGTHLRFKEDSFHGFSVGLMMRFSDNQVLARVDFPLKIVLKIPNSNGNFMAIKSSLYFHLSFSEKFQFNKAMCVNNLMENLIIYSLVYIFGISVISI